MNYYFQMLSVSKFELRTAYASLKGNFSIKNAFEEARQDKASLKIQLSLRLIFTANFLLFLMYIRILWVTCVRRNQYYNLTIIRMKQEELEQNLSLLLLYICYRRTYLSLCHNKAENVLGSKLCP